MDTVTINVGGTIFETSNETLLRFPNTRLARLTVTDPEYNNNKEHYFFDRNPQYFNSILDFYRTGSLHLPTDVCGATLREELEFWEVAIENISECCLKTYFRHDNDMDIINELKNKFEAPELDYSVNDYAEKKWIRVKRQIWLILEKPNSSIMAKVYNMLFLSIVLLSSLAFCLSTLPDLRQRFLTDEQITWLLNSSNTPATFRRINLNNPKEYLNATSTPVPQLQYIEWFCGVFFSIELLLHFAFCPVKRKFFRKFLNILDFILCIDFIVVTAMELNAEVILRVESATYVYIVFKSLTILRLFRFFRLVKQHSGLKILFIAFVASLKELILLLIVLLIACLFFACFMFYAEFYEPNTFPNMLIGIWWAIVTMTTLGYGDYYPMSPPGYVVGSLCSICGLFILAMPIAVVANNFNNYYERNKEREKLKLDMKRELKPVCRITPVVDIKYLEKK